MSRFRYWWDGACGRAEEPLWMSFIGAFLVMFVLPAIVTLYAVAFTPTKAEMRTAHHQQSINRNLAKE